MTTFLIFFAVAVVAGALGYAFRGKEAKLLRAAAADARSAKAEALHLYSGLRVEVDYAKNVLVAEVGETVESLRKKVDEVLKAL